MNYQRIYNQIVDRAKQQGRKKGDGTYYESHHTLPKCLGGSNKKTNLVLLTAREHFLVHWILVRIYPDNSKLIFAFWAMCHMVNKDQEERHPPGSRAFGEARELNIVNRSTFLKEYFSTPEGKSALERRTANFDYKKKVENTDYTVIVANTDYAARTANTDWEAIVSNVDYVARKANTDWKARSKKFNKVVEQFTKDGIFTKEWMSLKEAGEALKIDRSDISTCCRGKAKSAGGFVWKYKEQK